MQHILVDLQSLQGPAWRRGIGRYSIELAAALADARPDTRITAMLNLGVPDEDTVRARQLIRQRIPGADVVAFDAPWPWVDGDAFDPDRHRVGEALRDQLLRELAPDAVVVTSLFEAPYSSVLSVSGDERPPTAVVAYDLIPLTDRVSAPSPVYAPFYRHRLSSLSRADLVLGISDHTSAEVRRLLDLSEDRVVPIGGAAFGLPAVERSPARRGVLCVGGDSPRKNEEAALKAFALLERGLRSQHPLRLVGRHSDERVAELQALGNRLGLEPGDWDIAGEISDKELARAYSSARLVTVPSLAEGLGLPVLEAWAHSTPVIAAATTSLPEVVGRDDLLFDPHDVPDQAALMRRLLEDEDAWDAARAHLRGRRDGFTWSAVGQRTGAALEQTIERSAGRRSSGQPARADARDRRPSLALVTPWPPESTGVARHAAQVAPALRAHYDVTLVIDHAEAAAAARRDGWTVVAPDRLRPDAFHRVLFNLGNSPFHAAGLRLVQEIPGVCVAHDLDLQSVVEHLGPEIGCPPGALRYVEHGAAGLLDAHASAGLDLYRASLGVIVHSTAAASRVDAAAAPLGDGQVAFAPLVVNSPDLPDRQEARRVLGVPDEAVLISTFGRVHPAKRTRTVVEAVAALHDEGLPVRLAVVGPDYAPDYVRAMRDLADTQPVTFTGEVSDDEYVAWLAASDVAVQLRAVDRGESSGALVEALWAGCPLVVERLGSFTDIDPAAVVGVDSPATAADVREALRPLVLDPTLRARLGDAGRRVAERHTAPPVAQRYAEAIEGFYARWDARRLRTAVPPGEAVRAAGFASANRPDRRGADLVVDTGQLQAVGFRTGIERVLVRLARELTGLHGGRTLLCREESGRLVHHTAAASEVLGVEVDPEVRALDGAPVGLAPGATLLSLSMQADLAPWRDTVSRFRAGGGRYVQFVHDLLPLTVPDFFPPFARAHFPAWLALVAEQADVLVANSETTAAELRRWLAAHPPLRDDPPQVGWVRLGHDHLDLGDHADALRRRPPRVPGRSVLCVGTVEPRKGVEAVAAAAMQLWERGHDIEVTVAGRPGWAPGEVQSHLDWLDRSEFPFRWLRDVDDIELSRLYLRTDLLVLASRAEGFGLPLVEAAAHGVRVLARDIGVFREVLGDGDHFFATDEDLPNAILRRLSTPDAGTVRDDRMVTWRTTAEELLDLLAVSGSEGGPR